MGEYEIGKEVVALQAAILENTEKINYLFKELVKQKIIKEEKPLKE